MNFESCNLHDLKELWEVLGQIISCNSIWQRAAKQACLKQVKMDFVCKWGNNHLRPYSDNWPLTFEVVTTSVEEEVRKIDQELKRQYNLLGCILDNLYGVIEAMVSFVTLEAIVSVAPLHKGPHEKVFNRVWCLLLTRDAQSLGFFIHGLSVKQHKAFDKLVVEKLFASTTVGKRSKEHE